MDEKYKNLYSNYNLYGHVVNIVKKLNLSDDGIHLDIACGYAAVHDGLIEHNYNFNYVGIDGDKQSVNHLKKNGLEAYLHMFTCNEGEDFGYIEDILKGRKLNLITVLDFLEHIPQPENFIKMLNKVCKKHNAVLIVSVPNVCHRDITFKMIEGKFDYTETGLLDKTHLSLFSNERLDKAMNAANFQQVYCNDLFLKQSDQHFPSESTLLSNSTAVYQYLNYLKKLIDPFATVNQFVRAYLPIDKQNKNCDEVESESPFLSIITRTQGKRIETLSEVFLCLTGQTNTNFEVLIMGHKLTIDKQIAVERVIEELPDWIRKKVRLIKVDHGNRTVPLNVGFENALGKYITILDDDDIVFDNWVEEFYRLSQKFPGTTLHTYSLVQNWDVIDYHGEKALRAMGTPKDTYCINYNLLNQLKTNSCPTMSYAFPRYPFKNFGIRFNENLSTAEDWDFFMRTTFITGVEDSDVPTSIYRLWKNSENSYNTHTPDEWALNEKIIKKHFDDIPIILPKGYASKIIQDNNQKVSPKRTAHLYIDDGNGFCEDNVLTDNCQSDLYSCEFADFSGKSVSSVRFDPVEEGMIWVSDINVEVFTEQKVFKYKINDVKSNGIRLGESFLFLKPDPQIIIEFSSPVKIENVKIYCQIESNIPTSISEDIHRKYIITCKKKNIFYLVLRKIYHRMSVTIRRTKI